MAFIKKLIKTFTLAELLKGLGLTGKYFFKKKVTIQYPERNTSITTFSWHVGFASL